MEIEVLIEFPFSINQKVGVNCNNHNRLPTMVEPKFK